MQESPQQTRETCLDQGESCLSDQTSRREGEEEPEGGDDDVEDKLASPIEEFDFSSSVFGQLTSNLQKILRGDTNHGMPLQLTSTAYRERGNTVEPRNADTMGPIGSVLIREVS